MKQLTEKNPQSSHEQGAKPRILRHGCWIAILLLASGCLGRDRHKPSSSDPTGVQSSSRELWKATINTQQLGPLETFLILERHGKQLRGHSLTGCLPEIQKLPKAQEGSSQLQEHLFAFEATEDPQFPNRYHGRLTAPWAEENFHIQVDEAHLTGTIQHWLLGGEFEATLVDQSIVLRDYPAVLSSLDQTVPAKIFNPALLHRSEYQSFRTHLEAIAKAANDDLDLVLGFHFAWENTPFSHFQLRRSDRTAKAMFQFFDQMDVGYEAARVTFEDQVAILRVDTMMGNDTIEQIRQAFQEIANVGARALIIDLRGNGGGAFAVKPLAEHVIDEPITSGYFLSQKWDLAENGLPSREVLEATEVWDGWSISEFWRAVQELDIMKLRFEPQEPNFDGPVYLLVDQRSASATELAADVFRSSGVALLVGETTAGEMLSQSFFDLRERFMISLPVADYYSVRHGRIEGNGVTVDLPTSSGNAMTVAKQQLGIR